LAFFALLFGSIALAAQPGGHGQSSHGAISVESRDEANTISAFGMTIRMGCPVSLSAQHGMTAGLLLADKSRSQGLAQLLHLSLLDLNVDAKRIVSARVRVHGLSGKARVTQTLSAEASSSKDDGDFVRTLDVQFPFRTARTVSGDLLVPGMTAVLSIVVNSVTYDDGSTRSFSAQDNCRVTPDPLMLVSGR
jgi:hypothetical protein